MIKYLYNRWKKYKYESFVGSLDSYELARLFSMICSETKNKNISNNSLYDGNIAKSLEKVLKG